MGNTHAEIIRSPTLRLTKTRRLEPKISNLDSSDQRTHFHRSNVHCSCLLAQASLFFLLVSFSSGFFAAIRPWRPDSRSLPGMSRCVQTFDWYCIYNTKSMCVVRMLSCFRMHQIKLYFSQWNAYLQALNQQCSFKKIPTKKVRDKNNK